MDDFYFGASKLPNILYFLEIVAAAGCFSMVGAGGEKFHPVYVFPKTVFEIKNAPGASRRLGH